MQKIMNALATVGADTWNGITTVGTSTWNGITTAVTTSWNGIIAVPSVIPSILSGFWNIITIPITLIKTFIYGNLALFIGALVYDVCKGDVGEFKITNKLITFFNEEISSVKSLFDYLSSNMLELYKKIHETNIAIKKSYAEHNKEVYEIESSYKDLPIKHKALPGSSVDNTSSSNTQASNETPQIKNPITISVEFNDNDINVVFTSLIENNFKLYVTDEEKTNINNFFTEDVQDDINLSLSIDKNSFVKTGNKDRFLETTYFYNVLKNGEEITDELKYYKPNDKPENTAIKIYKLSNELFDQADIVEKINKDIINAITESSYTKEELSNAIKDCEKVNYDPLICSPLFEGAVNEYFDIHNN